METRIPIEEFSVYTGMLEPIRIDWSKAPAGYNWWCWDFNQQRFCKDKPTFLHIKSAWYVEGNFMNISFGPPPLGYDIRMLVHEWT